jgi:hypothetical protein
MAFAASSDPDVVFDTAMEAADNRSVERKSNEAGIVVSWLVRVVLFLAVIGVVGFDVGAMVVNTVTLDSSAEEVAITVSLLVSESPGGLFPDTRIYDMAVDVVEDETEGIEGARVLRKGTELDEAGNVHIRLRRRSDSILMGKIGPLEKFTIATADGQAGTN